MEDDDFSLLRLMYDQRRPAHLGTCPRRRRDRNDRRNPGRVGIARIVGAIFKVPQRTPLPGHHGDGSFFIAPKQGARAHHWKFGDMKKVEGVTDAQLKNIVAYVRAVQQANGLF